MAKEAERVAAATEENLRGFYNQLVKIIEEFKLNPSQIHNVDESCIDIQIGGKILAIKGKFLSSNVYSTLFQGLIIITKSRQALDI